jgi:single-strand DNA-binding protein
MSDTITITGLVGTDPREIATSDGLAIVTFRLGSTVRRFDRGTQRWVDGDTNWYSVTAFRQLAINCLSSLNKGQRAIVTGRIRIRDWKTDERTGVSVDIEADSIGHDLLWGTSVFTRSISSAVAHDTEVAGQAGGDELDAVAPAVEERVPF